jgi:DNA invertase Pin-like site-specific DNA recombinase
MGKLVGYARVSENGEDFQPQVDALLEIGCQKQYIFTDKVTGVKKLRPGLEACMASLNKGDTLVTWRLDRLGISVSHLVHLLGELYQRGVHFKSICDHVIDTTTDTGELIYQVLLSLAEFERQIIRERNNIGLTAARIRGHRGGRKKLPADHPKVILAKAMHKDKSLNVAEICQTLKVSRATYYRYLAISA